MDLLELGAIGELIGGVAVIGSLIYVGFQVRQNTLTMRSQTQFESARYWSAEVSRVAHSPDMARIVRIGSINIDELSPDERGRFVPWFVSNQFLMVFGTGDRGHHVKPVPARGSGIVRDDPGR